MLLKTIRIVLIVCFVLAAVAAGSLAAYHYTHDDVSAPVFTCDSDLLVVSANATEAELCAGMHAYDNIDGDITDRIEVKTVSPLINATDAIITYLVFDDASNAATYTRTLRYTDYTRPRFALSQPLSYTVGDRITLLDRLTAYDVIDGDISSRILLTQSAVSNTVAGSYRINVQVTNSAGSYRINVQVTNSAGDTALLPLTVTVNSASASVPTVRLTDYLIYVKQGEAVNWESYLGSVRDPLTGSGKRSAVVCRADSVDITTPGTYEVYYYYVGKSGETGTAILTVVVE